MRITTRSASKRVCMHGQMHIKDSAAPLTAAAGAAGEAGEGSAPALPPEVPTRQHVVSSKSARSKAARQGEPWRRRTKPAMLAAMRLKTDLDFAGGAKKR